MKYTTQICRYYLIGLILLENSFTWCNITTVNTRLLIPLQRDYSIFLLETYLNKIKLKRKYYLLFPNLRWFNTEIFGGWLYMGDGVVHAASVLFAINFQMTCGAMYEMLVMTWSRNVKMPSILLAILSYLSQLSTHFYRIITINVLSI